MRSGRRAIRLPGQDDKSSKGRRSRGIKLTWDWGGIGVALGLIGVGGGIGIDWDTPLPSLPLPEKMIVFEYKRSWSLTFTKHVLNG